MCHEGDVRCSSNGCQLARTVAHAPRDGARPNAAAEGSSRPPVSPKLIGQSHCCEGATRALVLYQTRSVRYYYMYELSDERGPVQRRALFRRNGGWERRFLFRFLFCGLQTSGGIESCTAKR